jgi:hypothetical protein
VAIDPQTLLVAGLIAFMFLIRTLSGGQWLREPNGVLCGIL